RDQVFAERREEELGAAGEAQQRWVLALEADRVADEVRPDAGTRREQHGVLNANFDVGECVPGRVAAVELAVVAELPEWDEFEEDAVIRHDAEQTMPRILRGDEAFRAGIDFAILHGVAADGVLEEAAERLEAGAAVDNEPQVGPNLGNRR